MKECALEDDDFLSRDVSQIIAEYNKNMPLIWRCIHGAMKLHASECYCDWGTCNRAFSLRQRVLKNDR